MRHIINLNAEWSFLKGVNTPGVTEGAEQVNLPHSWNAIDGQDGGNDYFRGSSVYVKTIQKSQLPEGRCFLEICGANSSADVYVGETHLCHHDGGYSTFRVDLTDHLVDETVLSIVVDNSPNDTVYPQMADFTFYGGLYRNVSLIVVPETHFDLEYYGGSGLKITPVMDGTTANVEVEVFVKNLAEGDQIRYTVCDKEGNTVYTHTTADTCVSTQMENAHLWHGRKDPYLYTAKVEILRGEEVLDTVSARFGCRSFKIDPEQGFILNGESYPLRGVSRHQDRWGIGNALLPEHHRAFG